MKKTQNFCVPELEAKTLTLIVILNLREPFSCRKNKIK